MPDQALLEEIIGQEHAVKVLAAALRSGHPVHAYLFAGPPGAGKMAAALEFAAALCCPKDGCGRCESCRKAAGGVHPDIVLVSPTGSLITVDQIREINSALSFQPHESEARVFIIDGAESLGSEGANAFLKSLEEPPAFVFFLLLATAADKVLPTIASRCQTVRFGAVPPADIEKFLVKSYGVSSTMAQAYARASGGNLTLAGRLCKDGALAQRRQQYLKMAQDISRGDWGEGAAAGSSATADGSAAVKNGAASGSGPAVLAGRILDAAREAGEMAAAAAATDAFTDPDSKRAKQDAHRRETAAQKREIALALGVMQSWFRDLMAVAAGAGESVINRDYELELEDQALPSRLDGYRRALEAIEASRAKLGYNIDLELALQAMFNELQEVI